MVTGECPTPSWSLPSAARLLVVFGAIVASNPNPDSVLILATLAPLLADQHTAPWPLLPPREKDSPTQHACP